jgi:hypothetical protein
MVCVIPLIRWQQQLTQHIWQTLVNQSPVVLWFQSEGSHNLEHKHQELLWRNSHTAEEGLISFTFLKHNN